MREIGKPLLDQIAAWQRINSTLHSSMITGPTSAQSARGVLADADCVIPVPLHWRREYARGFNQAREIARHLGPPVFDALTRSRSTTPQVTLSADERHANVRGAFVLRRTSADRAAPRLQECRAVLIDDVATTGATLDACARVLKQAGAADVCGLTAARRA